MALLLAFLGATSSISLKPAVEVQLPGRSIRVGDVADLAGLGPDLRARLLCRRWQDESE